MTRDQLLNILWATVRETAETPEDKEEVEQLIAEAEASMADPETNAKALKFLDALAAKFGDVPPSKEADFHKAIAPLLRTQLQGQVMGAYRKVHGL